jgi:hypothetical protein
MVRYSFNEVNSSFKRKRIRQVRKKKHIVYCVFNELDEMESVYTHMSHNQQDIDDYLFNQMATQLRIPKEMLKGLIECPVTQAELLAYLRSHNIIEPLPN